jgi:hypothetical protein
MREFEIKIRNAEHSRAVQERAFELGYDWTCGTGVKNQKSAYLQFWGDGDITWSNSPHGFELLSLDDMFGMAGIMSLLDGTAVEFHEDLIWIGSQKVLHEDLKRIMERVDADS